MLEKNRERRCRTMREVLRELETNRSTRHLYQFGPFQLDVAERRLAREGQPVSLKPKVFDLLVVLVENRGRLLEKEQLYQALWPDSVVEEVNLNVNVSALRKALGETPTNPQFIETIPKKGYRFIAAVTEQTIGAPPVRTATRPDPAATQLLPSAVELQPQLQSAPVENAAAQSFTVLDSAPLVSRSRPLAPRLLLAGLLLAVMATAVYVLRLAGRDEPMAKGIRTVAVLPFRSLQGSEADQALGLGMADALITRLGSLQLLTVRPTSAVLKYAAADADSLAAGRELKVDAVLEGRVQREEKMIRLSAQLLRVTDGAVLWAGKFDDFFTNIFAVQDSLSEKMAEMLAVRLTKNEQQAMTRRYTENTEAYQLYLLGSYHHYKLDEQNLEKALGYYQAAIEKDPHYPLPWAAMVGLYIGWDGTDTEDRHYRDKARAAAEKAISLAPELSEAWDSRGTIQMCFDWDFSGAEQSLRRAIELNPGNPDAHDSYALLLSALKRDDEAIREIETACRLAPTSAYFLTRHGTTLLHAWRYDQAIVQLHKALELDQRFPLAMFNLADAFSRKGQHREALEQLRKYRELTSARAVAGALIQMRAGQRAEAEKVLAESPSHRVIGITIPVCRSRKGAGRKSAESRQNRARIL
ncbi:MAG TPA: winged helix-turn-helix domain-containing protein [Blastocatellia bacterium]|nr:winged helix-turn-helix domain-containing protein [Blastocatellia bacterium]